MCCNLAAAVLGIAMIAMGEEIGAEMALRSFGHLVNNLHLKMINEIKSYASILVTIR